MTDDVKSDVFTQLEKMTIQFELSSEKNGNNENLIDLLKKAEKENNVKEIFKSINKLERCLVVDRSREPFYELFNVAFNQDPRKIFTIMNEKKSILDIYFLVRCLNYQKRYQLIEDNAINNPYLIFECIRQLTKDNWSVFSEIETEKCEEIIAKGLTKISFLNSEVWRFSISYFENKDIFYKILGAVLENVSEKSLLIYAETIKFGSSENNIIQVTDAFESLSDERFDYILNIIAFTVYSRWKEHCYNLKSKKQFLNSHVLSSYTNLIYWSIYYSINDADDFKNEFFLSYENLQNDMFQWYENALDFNTNFFVNITQLDLLIFVYSEKNYELLKHSEILSVIEKIKDIIERYNYLWDSDKQHQSTEMLDRIDKLVRSDKPFCLSK